LPGGRNFTNRNDHTRKGARSSGVAPSLVAVVATNITHRHLQIILYA
jgi:hypothetical protein